MKLKKSFWASSLILSGILSLATLSCKSTNLIPGESELLEKNLYSEYMMIADENFAAKKYDKAETFYSKCLENPDFYAEANYKLGKTYVYQKKYDKALPIYESILERDDENQTILETLAYLNAMTGNKEKAIEQYKSLIENNGQISSYYENLIIIYIQDKKIEQSEELLNSLKEKFPDCSKISDYESAINKLKN